MIYNTIHLLSFIQLHGSRDQPSAQEFTRYMEQQSPAPAMVLALARRGHSYGPRCCIHCNNWTGWCQYHQPKSQAAGNGQDVNNLHYMAFAKTQKRVRTGVFFVGVFILKLDQNFQVLKNYRVWNFCPTTNFCLKCELPGIKPGSMAKLTITLTNKPNTQVNPKPEGISHPKSEGISL